MASSSQFTSAPGNPARPRQIPTASIVALVAKGMTAREIIEAFPELKVADIRSALLDAAEVVRDPNASLRSADPVGGIVRRAQQSSGLAEDEATELAVSETNQVRRERANRRQ